MRFLNQGRDQRFEKGAVIIANGATDSHVYYIVEGAVQLFVKRGEQVVYSESLESGKLLGLVSAYTEGNKSEVSFEATCEVHLYCWEKEAFNEIVSVYPELAQQVIRDMSYHLRDLNGIV